jgi:hypothetical protein
MKKNDKNFEWQNKTQRAHATLLYSKSNTNPLNATKRKRKKKKKRNINPECKQKHAPLPHHQTKDAHICAKNRSTRKENSQTKKISPTKLQTHLNIPEPHGYIKNAARAQSTRLYPLRRKNPQ